MRIQNLKLWNFRKFGSAISIDLDKPNLKVEFSKGLNALIGENDSGKTAIIDALKYVFRTHSYEYIRVHENDFFQGSNRFRIEAKIVDFDPEEGKNFIEWMGYEEFVSDEGEKEIIPYLRLILDVRRNNQSIEPYEVKAGVDEYGYRLDAQARNLLKCIYLKPLRDANSELIPKRNSRLSQILLGHDVFDTPTGSHEFEKITTTYNEQVEKYFDDATKGKPLKDAIEKHTSSFIKEEQKISIESSRGSLKSILEGLGISLDQFFNAGLGSQNRLYMATELLHLEKESWTGLKLALIEELEAHLHPQAQLKVISSLQAQKDFQLILTTHSPNLASKIELQNIIVCDDNQAFSLAEGKTKLEKEDYAFLERFLDITKSNLFFSKGIIFVEGWTEEMLVPVIAEKIGCDLIKHGVSIVNVGHTNFLRYAKIFQRLNISEKWNKKISIIRDLDLKPIEHLQSQKFTKGLEAHLKKQKEKLKQKYDLKKETKEYQKATKVISAFKVSDYQTGLKTAYPENNIQLFLSPLWTLEYCFANSLGKLKGLLDSSFSSIHPETKIPDDSYEYYSKHLSKGKSGLSQVLAHKINEEMTREEILDEPQLKYIIDAIKHACE